MHICFITSEYPKEGYSHGGVGTFIQTLALELVKLGIEISVIGINYTDKNEIEDDNGIKIYRLTKQKIKGLTWLINTFKINRCISQIHRKQAISIVEGRELDLAFISKKREIKYIIRMNGGHYFFAKYENRKVKYRHAFMEKLSFKKADALIAVSDFVGKETLKLLDLNSRSYSVIYNPVDTSKFYVADTNMVKKHTVFFAGTIIEKKGIRQLIESLKYLVDDFPDIKLIVAGRDANLPGTNIPYRPILEKSITENIENHIEFLGVVANNKIPRYIEKAQVCCYPSHMEAMPLAWLEVMAMGKILIGGEPGPGPEAIIDGVTGFLVDPMHPKKIADKIRYVFNNSEKCNEISKNAIKRISYEFDIKITVEKNIDFYNFILSN